MTIKTWVFFIISFISLIFTIKSRRYIELSAPLFLLFAATSWADFFPRGLLREIWVSWRAKVEVKKHFFVSSLMIGVVVFILLPNIGLVSHVQHAQGQLNRSIPFDRYEPAAVWLAENTEEHSVVVHSDWDDWPMLFYHNTHNYYIVGLDPTFMYNFDQGIYDTWAELTRDGEADNLVSVMADTLGAEYAIIERNHAGMNEVFATNIYFRLVYEDDEVWIYKLINEQLNG